MTVNAYWFPNFPKKKTEKHHRAMEKHPELPWVIYVLGVGQVGFEL